MTVIRTVGRDKVQRRDYVRNLPAERYEIKGRITGTTGAAVFFRMEGWERDVCIPLSQCHALHREFPTTGYDRLIISAWIAKKKEII